MSFLTDLKFALRSLMRAKGLAITVILTLALGIGANAAGAARCSRRGLAAACGTRSACGRDRSAALGVISDFRFSEMSPPPRAD